MLPQLICCAAVHSPHPLLCPAGMCHSVQTLRSCPVMNTPLMRHVAAASSAPPTQQQPGRQHQWEQTASAQHSRGSREQCRAGPCCGRRDVASRMQCLQLRGVYLYPPVPHVIAFGCPLYQWHAAVAHSSKQQYIRPEHRTLNNLPGAAASGMGVGSRKAGGVQA